MKTAKIIISLAFAILTAGCGDSGNSSGGGGGGNTDFTVGELGYNPKERWPEAGSYSYDFDFTYNGVHCPTKQSFSTKADYCMGLQDQALNNDCALPVRKSTYTRECGNDFQEVNFRANFSASGFDQRLQRSCETGRPASTVFRTSRQFCAFLKDESLHQNCHWDRRLDRYLELKCTGDFSSEPTRAADPIPTPTPTPGPNPTPTPGPNPTPTPLPDDPLDAIPVVKELRAQGFVVNVDWQAIRQMYRYPRPGQPSMQEQMRIFWSELEANKQQLIRRKHLISEIEVTIYTNTRSYQGKLNLDLDFDQNPGELAGYFPLFDQLQRYRNQLGIDFSFIQSGQRGDAVSYAPLRGVLSAIERNWKDFSALDGVIKEFRLDDFAAYFAVSGTLTLRREHIEPDLTKYTGLLKPIAPLMTWAKANRVKLGADFDIEDESAKVHSAFALMTANIPSLNLLVKARMLKEINLFFTDSDVNYYSNLGTLHIAIGTSGRDLIGQVLVSLGKMAKMSMEIQRPIETFSSDLNENDHLKSVALLEAVWTKILPKANKIKKITVGYESQYYDGLQQLNIGAKTSQRETEKIIAEIK